MIEIEILLTFVYFLECTAVQCKDALSVYFHHTCLRPPLYIATGYQESLFVGWKVYSSSTNKAKIYSYSIFVQQIYSLQDKAFFLYNIVRILCRNWGENANYSSFWNRFHCVFKIEWVNNAGSNVSKII